MNTRFLIPGSIAAAVHVALFVALPREDWVRPVTLVEILPPRWENKPEDLIPPPEDPVTSMEPVKALAGAPTPVTLDEPFSPKLADVVMPARPEPINPIKGLKVLPETSLVGDIGGPGTGNMPTGIYSDGDLDRVPNAKVRMPPNYPPEMSRTGLSGSASVEFDVNTEGQVVRAVAVNSSHREFGDAAVRAVLKWRFEPGRRNGKVVPFRITQTIEFKLESN